MEYHAPHGINFAMPLVIKEIDYEGRRKWIEKGEEKRYYYYLALE